MEENPVLKPNGPSQPAVSVLYLGNNVPLENCTTEFTSRIISNSPMQYYSLLWLQSTYPFFETLERRVFVVITLLLQLMFHVVKNHLCIAAAFRQHSVSIERVGAIWWPKQTTLSLCPLVWTTCCTQLKTKQLSPLSTVEHSEHRPKRYQFYQRHQFYHSL